MPRTALQPVCEATRPDRLPLRACPACAGTCAQPTEEHQLVPCVGCEGGGWAPVAGELGGTRTYKTRPFLFNPGTGLLTVTRRNKTERYSLKEFAASLDFPCRAFEVVRQSGERSGEVYHLCVSRGGITCDCAGRSYEATARANAAAYYAGEEQFPSAGCIHSDAVKLLLAAGLFDFPEGEIPDEPVTVSASPARACIEAEFA